MPLKGIITNFSVEDHPFFSRVFRHKFVFKSELPRWIET